MPPVVHGAPLAAGPRPDAATCERTIRDDGTAAQRIRAAATLNGGALAADEATVAAAAADPSAAISPELGIPLTRNEETLVRTAGPGDWTPLYWWANVGAPERFGGYWLEQPGGWPTVAIAPDDSATMALARCLERPAVRVRYVQAAVTVATLEAIRERIRADRGWLVAQGAGWITLGRRDDIGRVPVGVEKPTPEIEALYRERYGWPVLLEAARVVDPL